METNKIHCMDCLEGMKQLEDNSIDLIVTDPPYGYGFMGKPWDIDVPHFDIWMQCYRVLKHGGFAFIMSAPRLDVLTKMALRLKRVGFRIDYSPIYWTYNTGFPKASNIGKMVDKRLGEEREVIGEGQCGFLAKNQIFELDDPEYSKVPITKPSSDLAKKLDGAYGGFQPKPAVEVIIVAMKPLSEKTHMEQAARNGKGVTWLDDCRVPHNEEQKLTNRTPRIDENTFSDKTCGFKKEVNHIASASQQGRFPANLLVSDNILKDNSKFFDLDKWAETLPFLCVPKASKSEKNKGCEELKPKSKCDIDKMGGSKCTMKTGSGNDRNVMYKNNHPTCKPIKLLSYLITLGSREGDLILDPFVGSGSTAIAALLLKRNSLSFELDKEYFKIANKRLDYWKKNGNK